MVLKKLLKGKDLDGGCQLYLLFVSYEVSNNCILA